MVGANIRIMNIVMRVSVLLAKNKRGFSEIFLKNEKKGNWLSFSSVLSLNNYDKDILGELS